MTWHRLCLPRSVHRGHAVEKSAPGAAHVDPGSPIRSHIPARRDVAAHDGRLAMDTRTSPAEFVAKSLNQEPETRLTPRVRLRQGRRARPVRRLGEVKGRPSWSRLKALALRAAP
jgi:hypothetical protein